MARLNVNEMAPDFTLDDFRGETFRLREVLARSHALLVFNRGFV